MSILRLICILSILLLFCPAASAVLDPFDYLEHTYSYIDAVMNPHPEYGNIVGADGFNNGTDFAILWENGKVGFFHEGEISPYKIIQTLGRSGISEVPADIYGGDVAVTDPNFVYFYDQDGNLKGGISVVSDDIYDISYDSQMARLLLITSSNLGYLDEDNDFIELALGSHDAIEVIDMQSSPEYYNLLQAKDYFSKIAGDGTLTGNAHLTNLGNNGDIQGIAYTNNYAIMALEPGFYVYPKLEFQDHLETQPYEPQITITSPANNKVNNENKTEVFQYQVTSNYDIANCTIIINDTVTEGLPIEKDTTNSFPVFLENDSYLWHIECRDASGRLGESEPRSLTVNVQHTSLQDGLIGYWSFDEGTGGTAYDYSGNNNHGTIHEATYVDGVLGKALSFDGVDDYVEIPDSESLNSYPPITVSCWINIFDFETDNIIIMNKGECWGPIISSDHHVWLDLPDLTPRQFYSPNTLTLGNWQHIVFIYDGNFVRIYENADESFSQQVSGDLDKDALSFIIGANSPIPHFDSTFYGLLDEVRIYNRALSDGEIQMLYNNPDVPDLIENVYNGGQFLDDNIISGSDANFAGVVDPNMTVTLFIDGQPEGQHFTSNGNWSITAGSLSEGYHQAAIRLMNTAGNESDTSDSLSFVVDLTKPVISDMQVQPFDCQPAGQIFTIQANATDACSDLWEIKGMDCDIRYSDQSLIESIDLTHQGSGLFSGTWDSTGHDSGSYPIDFTVWDIAGNPRYEIRGISLCVDSPTAYCGDSEHPYPTGDFNKDCYVDIDDLLLMASNWLDPVCAQNDDCLIIDLSDDNEINLDDLAVFGSTWLSCSDPYPPCGN